MKTICFTGHRPDKLNGYDPKNNKKLLWKLHEVIEYFIINGVDTFISGMALGIDMWCAKIVLKLRKKYPHIKLVCAVPCLNHPRKWNKENQDEWRDIVTQCDEFVLVTKEDYKPYLMQVRNEYMVDRADEILAVHDGSEGGTGNCIKYARKMNKEIQIINPNDYK